jgi:hypothetical protein
MNVSTSTGTMFFIAINGVIASKGHYISTANMHLQVNAQCLYGIPANTTVTIDARVRTAGAAAGCEICNSASDQSQSPSYGVELRYIAWGRT